MKRQWIKVWLDLLDERNYFKMPDHLWRFTVELWIAAGKLAPEDDDDGFISPAGNYEDLAFMLHRPVEEVEKLIKELDDLKTPKVLESRQYDDSENRYLVIGKFKDRQRARTNAERVYKYQNK